MLDFKTTSTLLGLSLLLVFASGCASAPPSNAPPVVDKVDLERYLGTWYEQAHKPIRVQKGCIGTTATYSLREDGDIRVVNRCIEDEWGGEEKVAEGKAWVVDKETNARLEVQFFWPFSGDYWIVGLDEEYQWAIVGSPDYDYLWLLTRDPVISPERYEDMVARARALGYEVDDLIRTPQREASEDAASTPSAKASSPQTSSSGS
jgi:apolipoprotein D and lipocalin family protein